MENKNYNYDNSNGHSWHESSWIKFVITAVIVFLATSFVADVRFVDAERNGCERRQPIFRTLAEVLDGASVLIEAQSTGPQARTPAQQKLAETFADSFATRSAKIKSYIVEDCDKAYPHLLNFVE